MNTNNIEKLSTIVSNFIRHSSLFAFNHVDPRYCLNKLPQKLQSQFPEIYFAKKVPFGSNPVLIRKALEELNYTDTPFYQIDLQILSVRLVELSNKPISDALEEQESDIQNGHMY